MREVLALAWKDIKLLRRDKAGFFFVFFFPLLYAIFFGIIFSGGGGGTRSISLALVDEDSTEASIGFARILEADAGLKIQPMNRAEAVSSVQRGKKVAYVVLPKGFSQTQKNLFWGDPTKLEIGVDPARSAETAMLQGVITAHFMDGMMSSMSDANEMRGRISDWLGVIRSSTPSDQETMSDLERFLVKLDTAMAEIQDDATISSDSVSSDEKESWQPLNFEVSDVSVQRDGPRNSFEITFPQAIVWGLIGCAAAFGISLVSERTKGTLVRLRMAPLQRWQILAGKAAACLMAILFVTILLFLISMLIFGVRPNSLSMLALAILSAGLCFTGIMMLLAVLGRTEASAGGIGWAVLLIMAMTGGGMVPLFVMPSWLQALSVVSPVRWAILAMEGAVWRGFTLNLMLLHCGVLLAVGAICFSIGAKVFRWTEA